MENREIENVLPVSIDACPGDVLIFDGGAARWACPEYALISESLNQIGEAEKNLKHLLEKVK